MPPKIRVLKAELRKAGFRQEPGKGSHTKWGHPLLPKVKITLAGNDGDDAQRYQEAQVRQAIEELRETQRRQP